MTRMLLVSGALLALSAPAFALSFAGDDWKFSYTGVLKVRTSLLSEDVAEGETDVAVTVTQTEANKFSFPVPLSVFSGTGDFDVAGTVVTDINTGKTTDPFDVNGINVRVTYPTFNLVGDVTGVNNGFNQAFGPRAYQVTGRPQTVTNLVVEAELAGVWLNLGNQSSVELTSWSLERAQVPEPATLLALGAGLVALARRRK